jgi:hypothetical protein
VIIIFFISTDNGHELGWIVKNHLRDSHSDVMELFIINFSRIIAIYTEAYFALV